MDKPEPGFFLIRLVKKGPWVPAQIRYDFGHWWAEVQGKVVGNKSENPLKADLVLRIWHYGREITAEEHRRRLATPASEQPDPHQPVDLRARPSLF